jgi:hypothetical protein
MRIWFLGLIALLAANVAVAQTPAPPAPVTPQAWQAASLADIDALAAALRDNSPIPFDKENPQYAQWLIDGAVAARARAAEVRDAAGHFYTLAAFANGFGDPHIHVGPIGALPAASWPGFVAASDGAGGAVVASRGDADPNDPPLGARILRCDGALLSALAQERVFPFVLNPRLAVDQRRAISRLFLDRGNPFAPPPRVCDIEAQGQTRSVTLRWRPVPSGDSFWSAYGAASGGPTTAWGVSQPAPGVAWIGIPTFRSGDTADKLAALVKAVEAEGPAMRQSKAIVFDVRGNTGGNSAWAVKIARAALGANVVGRAMPKGKGAVDWRASAGNAAYWADFAKTAEKEFGPLSTNTLWAKFVSGRLDAAKAANPPIWREGDAQVGPGGGLTRRRPTGLSPFPARVYLLSNGSCGSSCLNFADIVLHVPGAKLIGSATAADGAYMEVRDVALPSGLVTLSVPQKVYRGAPRGPMEAYAPDIAYTGLWDDGLVRAWALKGIAGETR